MVSSTAARYSVNSVGARTQPCLILFLMWKGSHISSNGYMPPDISSWIWRIIVKRLSGHPYILRTLHKVSLSTVSKAYEEFKKTIYSGVCCSTVFSWNSRREITSLVDRSVLKPHWLSGRTFSVICSSLLRKILASIFPAMVRREIPRWFPQ